MEMQLASVNQLNFLENRTTGWIRESNRLLFLMIHQGEVEGRHLRPLQFRSFGRRQPDRTEDVLGSAVGRTGLGSKEG